jgi:hypothetical protein
MLISTKIIETGQVGYLTANWATGAQSVNADCKSCGAFLLSPTIRSAIILMRIPLPVSEYTEMKLLCKFQKY